MAADSSDSDGSDRSAGGRDTFPVVAVGASAGGLAAITALLDAMPAEPELALVVIPHLDPERESLMVELLSRHTPMPVMEITHNLPIEQNRVYVIPPGRSLSLRDGVLILEPAAERAAGHLALDRFFRALAGEMGARAIGIVLSGTGTHGSSGIQAIKASGGIVIVQDPATAEYDSMPRAAVATGVADAVLDPAAMPELLVDYVRHPYARAHQPGALVARAPDVLTQILALVRTRTRHDFRAYRKSMLTRRIERRMGLLHVDDPAQYVERLRESSEELAALCRDLLIGVTGFFREPEAFQQLEALAVSEILAAKAPDEPIRVWVPGCSSGEEAYSLAMVFIERLSAAPRNNDLQIFASDIDDRALGIARRAIYPSSIAADVPASRLRRFFSSPDDEHYEVRKQVRESVVFASQNLISDPPFSRLDLISCRNLLIYLEPEVQRKVIALFHFALRPDGYLFLGPSESVGRRADMFETKSKKWRIYRRIGPTRRDVVDFPIAAGDGARAAWRTPSGAPPGVVDFAAVTRRNLLHHYAPASVLVNQKHEVLYFSGPVTDFLALPDGEPTRDLLAMARQGLRTKLRGAITAAARSEEPVVVPDAQVKRDGGYVAVRIEVRPVEEPRAAHGLLLVSFEDAEVAAPPEPVEPPDDDDTLIRQLEWELDATRSDLQSTIEDLETSNEEFKASNEEVMSMNEELQSANEELETSKEELQSLNEEISTVNNQLQEKVEELERSNSDMTNLLASTDIATVFLDTELRIRRFTPVTRKLMSLIPTDVGRPLADITRQFTNDQLLEDAGEVLSTLARTEREVETSDGRWYLRCITPYRTEANRIEGVVLTYTDVTALRHSQAERRADEQRAREVADALPVLLAHVDRNGRYVYVNAAHVEWFGVEAGDLEGQAVRAVIGKEAHATVGDALERGLAGEVAWRVHRLVHPVRGVRTMELTVLPARSGDRTVTGVFMLDHDVTDRERARQEEMERLVGNHVLAAQAEEREAIARELHDETGQVLSAVLARLAALDGQLEGRAARTEARGIREEIRGLVDSVGRLARGLFPVGLESAGLGRAVEDLARSAAAVHGFEIRTDVSGDLTDGTLPGPFTHAVYRIVQEAVTNVTRHADARQVSLSLARDGEFLVLAVEDDGHGFEPAGGREGPGLGIVIMQKRAAQLGGSLVVESIPGDGTVVRARIPFPGTGD